MGCCRDRDRRPFSDLGTDITEQKKPRSHIIANRPLIEVNTSHLSIPVPRPTPIYTYSDPPGTLKERVAVLEDREREGRRVMARRGDWDSVCEAGGVVVRLAKRTVFSNTATACYLYIDFQADIDPGVVILALDDLEIRRSWDKAVTSIVVTRYRETEYELGCTQYTLFTLSRKFTELRRRTKSATEVEIVSCSVAEQPVSGDTFFSLLSVKKTQSGTTALEFCYQMDFHLPSLVKNLYESSRGGASQYWLQSLKSKVIALSQHS